MHRDLDQARTLITALAGLVKASAPDLGPHAAAFRDGLAGSAGRFREYSIHPDEPGRDPANDRSAGWSGGTSDGATSTLEATRVALGGARIGSAGAAGTGSAGRQIDARVRIDHLPGRAAQAPLRSVPRRLKPPKNSIEAPANTADETDFRIATPEDFGRPLGRHSGV